LWVAPDRTVHYVPSGTRATTRVALHHRLAEASNGPDPGYPGRLFFLPYSPNSSGLGVVGEIGGRPFAPTRIPVKFCFLWTAVILDGGTSGRCGLPMYERGGVTIWDRECLQSSASECLASIFFPRGPGRVAGLVALIILLSNNGLENAGRETATPARFSLHHIHTDEDNHDHLQARRPPTTRRPSRDWTGSSANWRKEEERSYGSASVRRGSGKCLVRSGATGPSTWVCGYRSPTTNAMLRRRSSGGWAQFSQHTLGKAMDFFIPGARLLGGVAGCGPAFAARGAWATILPLDRRFVHLDVGSVRQLAAHEVTINSPACSRTGRTVHVPSDGHPFVRLRTGL